MGSPVVIASPRKSPLSGRRINKPLVEKKRRARINGCLGQLKSLILTAMHTEQGAQVSRLEKADILEMTVNYLRQIQRQQVTAVASSEPDVLAKFSAGYTECATEVIRYINSVKCVAPEVKSRLESHLVDKLRGSVPFDSHDDSASISYTRANGNSGNNGYTRQVSSSQTTTEEASRHYQTAVDLVNMASSVPAKENSTNAALVGVRVNNLHHHHVRSAQLTSTNTPPKVLASDLSTTLSRHIPSVCVQPGNTFTRYPSSAADLIQVQSSVPPRVSSREPSAVMISSSVHENNENRHARECLEQSYTSTTSKNIAGGHNDFNSNSCNGRSKHLPNVTSNISNYLTNFQRPLHIHIPEIPPPATPSPPFLHPHVAYPQEPTTNPESATSLMSTYNFDDAPPTILYGCQEYHMQVQSTPSPEEAHCRQSTTVHVSNHSMNSVQYGNHTFLNITDSTINKHQPEHDTSFSKRNIESMDTTHKSHLQCHRAIAELERPAAHSGKRTTPSPPTLLPEDSYSTTGTDDPNRYSKLPHHEWPEFFERCGHLSSGLMVKYEDDRELFTDRNHHTSTGLHQSKNNYDQPSLHQDKHSTATTTMNSSRECSSAAETFTAPLNNGFTIPSCASSRQNDTSLSPPTLKKRLLQAQGSEVDWTTPRCNGVTVDKRSNPFDAGLSECGQNPRFWHDAETRSLVSREPHPLAPTVLFCAVPGHAISADDGLWRPW